MQEYDEDQTCIICLEPVTDDAAYPCEHTLHARCATRWFYTQLTEGNDMTCPACRKKPTNGWRVLRVTTPSSTPLLVMDVPVGPDTTVEMVKAHMSWARGFPPVAIRLFSVLTLNETTKRPLILHNSSWVGAFKRIYVHTVFMEAEYFYMDLPRGPLATTHHRHTCPLSNALLLNPILAADGMVYEQAAIVRWLQTRGNHSPKVPTRAILPLKRVINPTFHAVVSAIQLEPPRPTVTELDREITVSVVCSRVGARPFTVRYGDSMVSIARRAMPNAQRFLIATKECVAFRSCDPSFTVASAYVKDGDTLNVMKLRPATATAP